ncbi:hypothetical protein CI610_01781 [invertebrate metagenome]|uniref:Uncharacterized protein n=1 Tax=invertebrate metagenome TaxID=1711999 RepID=A0A2H9T7P2_9ZZZZ
MYLLPNETIPGFMARTQRLAIHHKADNFYQSILDCNYSQTCGVATYRLKKLSELLDIDQHKLILEHTAYPYFSYFMTKKHTESLHKALCSETYKPLESETGSVNSRLGIPNYHSFCPLCAEQNIQQFGVAYYHQIHTLPAVSACYIHGCKLVRKPIQPKILSIPDMRNPKIIEASKKEILFAKLSARLCEKSEKTPSLANHRASYQQKLSDLGYTTESGKIRSEKLLSDIRYFWRELLVDSDLRYLRTDGKQHHFVRDVLGPANKRTHPVKHILLLGFINHLQPSPEKIKQKAKKIVNSCSQSDIKKAIDLLRQGVSLNKTAELSGVSYYTVRKLIVIHKIPYNTKPRKITPSQEKEAIKLLKTGLSMKKIGERVGLSESGIDNLLNEYPKIRAKRRKLKKQLYATTLAHYREQSIQIIKANQHLTRKELMCLNPAMFIWLKNHDKKWLYHQMPVPLSPAQVQACRYRDQKKFWDIKQQLAIQSLQKFARNVIVSPPKNQRLSVTFILKQLAIRNTQTHIRRTMPIFWQQLTRMAENYEDFQLRKLYGLYQSQPSLFTVHSAKTLLRMAAAYPPVSDGVLEQAKLFQKGDKRYYRPKVQYWLLLKTTSPYPVQQPYCLAFECQDTCRQPLSLAAIKISHHPVQ